jgi:CheY-like chemotaxis protein
MIEKQKIFIIDDDSFLLNMYSMKFEKSGFEAKIAASGEDALQILRDGYKPDVILMDLVMPITDGFSIYESIKKEKLAPKALTIMLTNQSILSDIERAKELGIHGFIVKATTIPSEVVTEVLELLKKYSSDN